MKKKLLTVLATGLFAFSICSASNVIASTVFTDQTAFLNALEGGGTTLNFDALDHGTIVTNQFEGIDFQGSAQIYDEENNPSGGAFHTAPNVLLNTNRYEPITFTFNTPVDAVGFFNTSIVDREQVTLYDTQRIEIFSDILTESSVNFLGYLSDVPIASGEVIGIVPETYGTIFIDTLSYGNETVVPLPGAFWLLGSGFAGLIGLRRKKSKK